MIYDVNCKYFNTIIIGSGGAGLMSAISASDNNLQNIAIISKVLPTNSHTVSAKGGINASLGNVTKDDWRWHAFDTIKGSDFLADEDAVEVLCKNACDAIIYLEKNGVVFSRDENNKIAQRAYGGQSTDFGKGEIAYRACYSKDNTGQTILHTLYQQALKKNINFFNEYFVIDLLVIVLVTVTFCVWFCYCWLSICFAIVLSIVNCSLLYVVKCRLLFCHSCLLIVFSCLSEVCFK